MSGVILVVEPGIVGGMCHFFGRAEEEARKAEAKSMPMKI